MIQTTRYLILTFAGGLAALAQMPGGAPGGGSMPGGTKPLMMGGQSASRMMTGQMMKAELMRGMVGTMTQMHQMMEKMAGTLEQRQAMDAKSMNELSAMMDDMASMMKEMAARMRDGHVDAAMLKRMNDRLDTMGKSMKGLEAKPAAKP